MATEMMWSRYRLERKFWYLYRVKILAKYLREVYGSPRLIPTDTYKTELAGKKGIIVFEVSGWTDVTGHADLWNGSACVGSDYGDRASQIMFWETF
ncbi:T6SS effector amidase Tae4 family protein [Microbulbifer echini]|uniref:T6SS effector amidase Tae4 family protein n=1 Tax=Microbulbifer echini TaxID=1529067 RepID=A0ABV4NLM8_9GAMM